MESVCILSCFVLSMCLLQEGIVDVAVVAAHRGVPS
jgi:hypothetical protein